jgi:hypothetical protein
MAVGVALAASPAGGHVGGWAHNWTTHIRPKADARYLPNRNLPRGTTIRGAYEANGLGPAASAIDYAAISWGHQLASAPVAHFIPFGDPAPSGCPGSPTNPRAQAGHLCIYEVETTNLAANRGIESHGSVSRWATGIFVTPQNDGYFRSKGVWAVTAP